LSANDDFHQHDVIAFLSNPASYEAGVGTVERCETHGSIVFLAGEHAYKLKRAVKFPYMDYSTVGRREQMCRRELEVNRRTAPMLYLDVKPVVRGNSEALRFGTDEERSSAADWVLVMRRFDQENLLEQMRIAGNLTPPLMRSLAETVASFHARAEITPGFGGATELRNIVEENTAILTSMIGRPFGAESTARYCAEVTGLLRNVSSLLDARRDQGRVRRCHGDLHLNNICMIGAVPVLFDAIEFSDRFACIDVLYDLAFLLMDLDRHGMRGHANAVLNRYLELTGDHAGVAALPLFLSCRAAIRAHTAVAAAEAMEDRTMRGAKLQHASSLLDHALSYLAKPSPLLVAVGGVSGTGKTTLARALAPLLGAAPGAIVIRSDVIRKQLMGVHETARLPESAYAPAVTQAVYDRIAELATTVLATGYIAVADAVYGKESERLALAKIADRTGLPFRGVWLEAPAQLLEPRITSRRGDASDATTDVLRAQLGFVSTPGEWTHVSAAGSPDQTIMEARRALGC